MMNCADRAFMMSLWEYEARLYHWNEAHGSDDGDGGGRPDPRVMQGMVDKLNEQLRAGG